MTAFCTFGARPKLQEFIVKSHCGTLIHTGQGKYLWVITPFKDASSHITLNNPDVPVEAIIVLNQQKEGSLMLSSFLAADKTLPVDNIYVLNPSQPHDWHPNYGDRKQSINDLIKVKALMPEKEFGGLTVFSVKGLNFIQVNWLNLYTGKYQVAFVGEGIYFTDLTDLIQSLSPVFHFIGSFNTDKFRQCMEHLIMDVRVRQDYRDENQLNFYLQGEIKNANPCFYVETMNHLGFTVNTINLPCECTKCDRYTG